MIQLPKSMYYFFIANAIFLSIYCLIITYLLATIEAYIGSILFATFSSLVIFVTFMTYCKVKALNYEEKE